MKNNKNGFAVLPIVSIVIVMALVGIGAYVYFNQIAGHKPVPVIGQNPSQQGAMDKPNPKTEQETPVNPEISKAQPANLIDTNNWQTYRNDKYGFQFRYPGFYSTETNIADIQDWARRPILAVAGFSNKTTNKLYVGVFQESVDKYKLVDNPGGGLWCFDANAKQWVDCKSKTPAGEYGPKRIEGDIEAYLYRTGDITCRWDYIIIPNSVDGDVIEIINQTCDEFDAGLKDYKKPAFELDSKELFSTFNYIN